MLHSTIYNWGPIHLISSHILSYSRSILSRSRNRGLNLETKTVAGADGVVVAASVLAEVGVIRLAPLLGVEGAVSAIGNVVLAKEVGIEERAGVEGTIGARVAAVVGGVGGASTCAFASIVYTGEVLDTHVGVLAGSADGSIDGTTELDGAVKVED